MTPLVKIPIDDELSVRLERLRKKYPGLDSTELFKLSLSELDHKVMMQERKEWADSLPILELSQEEKIELKKALFEADEENRLGINRAMSVDELMDFLEK